MSLQDIDSISTMMLGELRDVKNLEKELAETKEAVVIQERRFEHEVDNICALDKRKLNLERSFFDIAERAEVERIRATELFEEHRKTITSSNLDEQVLAYVTNRDCAVLKVSSLTEAVGVLEKKLSDIFEDKSKDEILQKVGACEQALQEKKTLVDQHHKTLEDLMARAEHLSTESKHLEARHVQLNGEVGAIQSNLDKLEESISASLLLQASKTEALEKLKQDADAENATAKDKILVLASELKTINDENASKLEERDRLLSQQEALGAENATLVIELAALKSEVETSKAAHTTLLDKKKKHEDEIQLITQEIYLLTSQTEAFNLRAKVCVDVSLIYPYSLLITICFVVTTEFWLHRLFES
jgi:chromosome segregation ATPase